jgi:hypothetical protein
MKTKKKECKQEEVVKKIDSTVSTICYKSLLLANKFQESGFFIDSFSTTDNGSYDEYTIKAISFSESFIVEIKVYSLTQ